MAHGTFRPDLNRMFNLPTPDDATLQNRPVPSSSPPSVLRRRLLQSLLGSGLLLGTGPLWAKSTGVQRLRMAVTGQTTRIVLDLDGPLEDHRIFTLNDPARVVVDLKGAHVQGSLQLPAGTGEHLVHGLRHAQQNTGTLRIVLDLHASAQPRSFLLLPAQGLPHRLVIDVSAAALEPSRQQAVLSVAGTPRPAPNPPSVSTAPDRLRDLVIAIDPGHGGHDPGAIGPGGTREKDVVLEISRRLVERIEATYGMRAMMTRTGDYFLPLRERILRARGAQADLFLSIHADAIENRQVQGSSVYILSDRGATSERARFLADSENNADLRLGGMPVDQQDDGLRSILLDMTQSGSLELSNRLAQRLISELHRVGKVRKPEVERANFAVLRSPDIPSVLVEAAFISNPAEERKLRTPSFQEALADAVLTGMLAYLSVHAPVESSLAAGRRDQHIIRPGENLTMIAQHYRLSVAELRAVNALSGDVIHAGQILRIPVRGS
jgi:N-acetylmuramoyl-L-alanine amidase